MASPQTATVQSIDKVFMENTLLRVTGALFCHDIKRVSSEARMSVRGKREFIQVLRLMETFDQNLVADAVKDALKLGAPSFDAVKQLILCRIEKRPPRLDLAAYPYLPKAAVQSTRAADYTALLDQEAA